MEKSCRNSSSVHHCTVAPPTTFYKLEEFLTHIQVSGDPTYENGQLDRVLCIGALVKSEGEGNEGRDVGLQRVVNVVRHLLEATTNGTGRKAHSLKDRTLLKTSWGFAGRIAMLLPSRVAGRTLGLRGPDLARGPEVARPCSTATLNATQGLSRRWLHMRSSD